MYNVGFAYSSVSTIRENADRTEESAKCLDNIKCQQSQTGSACLCSKTTTVLSEWTVPKTMDVSYIFIPLDINTVFPGPLDAFFSWKMWPKFDLRLMRQG